MSLEPEIQSRAVDSLFELFEAMSAGAVSVDKHARIVWLNDKYRRLLRIGDECEVLGREIEEVIPESLLRHVVNTGQPILVDIMRFSERNFVVSRLPLKDEEGQVIGAVGFVLYEDLDGLRPLISKFERLQQRLTQAEAELAAERRCRYSITSIVGQSEQIGAVKARLLGVAQHNSPVLITGETGTGKELLAHAIHAASIRRDRPFVAINMAAIPETLLEAEFFGVSPGAFTDAGRTGRKGKFALADGGTLFLDEIGDMPMSLQAKLLRVIEQQEFERVGSSKMEKADVRIVAATSQDLEQRMAAGRFRKDLYYRLNVLPIHVPALRERPVDIPALCTFFLERIAPATNSAVKSIDEAGLRLLSQHDWPGNVRELKNIIDRVCLFASKPVLGADDIRPFLSAACDVWAPSRREGDKRPETGDGLAGAQAISHGAGVNGGPSAENGPHAERAAHQTASNGKDLDLPGRIAIFERREICRALELTGGKKAPAARLLGISRSQLYDKIREYSLPD